jgi:hypothetical protein
VLVGVNLDGDGDVLVVDRARRARSSRQASPRRFLAVGSAIDGVVEQL